jgi:acyl-CoA thioesterase FadM
MKQDSLATLVSLRPRYEGSNVRTWIGFKHLLYLIEEGVIQWFRERDCGPQALYHDCGLELEILDCSAVLLNLLGIDDLVNVEVIAKELNKFSVKLLVRRGASDVVILKSTVTAGLIRNKDAYQPGSAPKVVQPFVLAEGNDHFTESRALHLAPSDSANSLLARTYPGTYAWTWLARYFHCHYSSRVQYSAYVRALEEVVDRFLAHRGISVPRMLTDRGWIPVVSRVQVQMLADVHMDEQIHTLFKVERILKETVYDAQMECYVQRGNMLIQTASAQILHGYAISRGEAAGTLAQLDDDTIAALGEAVSV